MEISQSKVPVVKPHIDFLGHELQDEVETTLRGEVSNLLEAIEHLKHRIQKAHMDASEADGVSECAVHDLRLLLQVAASELRSAALAAEETSKIFSSYHAKQVHLPLYWTP